MAAMSVSSVIMFVAAIAMQLVGVAMIPLNKGMTQIIPSIICIAGFAGGVSLVSRLIHNGASLGVLVPLQAAAIPLCTVFIGILAFNEPSSLPRIALLVAACGFIGLASTV